MPTSPVSTYAAAWQETDADARSALLEQCWAPDGVYVDPTARAEGRQGLSRHIGAFHESRPGYRIDLASAADGHGPHLRFAWTMVAPDGAVVLEGMDYGELDDAGQLRRIVGFFGALS